MNSTLLFIAALLFIATIAFGVLWALAVMRIRALDHWWRHAMWTVTARDYDAALKLADTIAASPADAPLARPLRDAIAALDIAEKEQQHARHDLEDVLSSLQDAVLVVDSEARLRYLNAPALQWFNVRVEEVLGAQVLEALPSFGLDAAVRTALQEGRSSESQVNLYAPELREVLLRVAPVRGSEAKVSGAVAILQDLTEMRRLERVRREFVANASHELRTPIATIRATAETIMSAQDDPELSARFLPHLVLEAERLSRLVSDLLDLAKSEAPSEAPRQEVNLTAVTNDVIQRLHDKAESQQLTVSCDCDAPVNVAGDAASLEQVVFNLLDNAIMYTPAGGRITLDVAPETNGSKSEAHGAKLTVRDTGIGIPAADVSRVFERFYRVDKARSRSQGGTGLGLAIVKHIVENHGGHISVESEVGRGTTFTVTLPGT